MPPPDAEPLASLPDLAELSWETSFRKRRDPSGNHLAWKQPHLVSDKLACASSLTAALKSPLENK